MTTRVVCIRHGETAWNATGRWQGHAPVPLNEAGHEQARQLARYLAETRPFDHDQPISALYSSDLARALQTARPISDALGLPVQTDERLREVDLGEWQGLTRAEAHAWDRERFEAFLADWYTVPTPSGESRNQLKARARAAFDAITARHPGATVALVTHGGTLGMLIESLFGKLDRPSLTNTSLTIVAQAPPGSAWELVRVAWTPHLNENPIGETW